MSRECRRDGAAFWLGHFSGEHFAVGHTQMECLPPPSPQAICALLILLPNRAARTPESIPIAVGFRETGRKLLEQTRLMRLHAGLLTFETRVVICATISLAVLAVSLLLAFISDRAEYWWVVKISTGIAALCAVILVIVNIAMYG